MRFCMKDLAEGKKEHVYIKQLPYEAMGCGPKWFMPSYWDHNGRCTRGRDAETPI